MILSALFLARSTTDKIHITVLKVNHNVHSKSYIKKTKCTLFTVHLEVTEKGYGDLFQLRSNQCHWPIYRIHIIGHCQALFKISPLYTCHTPLELANWTIVSCNSLFLASLKKSDFQPIWSWQASRPYPVISQPSSCPYQDNVHTEF